jgi:hypothetical protein
MSVQTAACCYTRGLVIVACSVHMDQSRALQYKFMAGEVDLENSSPNPILKRESKNMRNPLAPPYIQYENRAVREI